MVEDDIIAPSKVMREYHRRLAQFWCKSVPCLNADKPNFSSDSSPLMKRRPDSRFFSSNELTYNFPTGNAQALLDAAGGNAK